MLPHSFPSSTGEPIGKVYAGCDDNGHKEAKGGCPHRSTHREKRALAQIPQKLSSGHPVSLSRQARYVKYILTIGLGAEFGDDAPEDAIDHADGAASVQDLGMLRGQP